MSDLLWLNTTSGAFSGLNVSEIWRFSVVVKLSGFLAKFNSNCRMIRSYISSTLSTTGSLENPDKEMNNYQFVIVLGFCFIVFVVVFAAFFPIFKKQVSCEEEAMIWTQNIGEEWYRFRVAFDLLWCCLFRHVPLHWKSSRSNVESSTSEAHLVWIVLVIVTNSSPHPSISFESINRVMKYAISFAGLVLVLNWPVVTIYDFFFCVIVFFCILLEYLLAWMVIHPAFAGSAGFSTISIPFYRATVVYGGSLLRTWWRSWSPFHGLEIIPPSVNADD